MVKRCDPYVTPGNLDERLEKWLAAVRESTAPRPWLVLKPARCALLVVDMLNYFAHPDGRCWLPATEAAIPRIGALLAAWRGLGAPVVFTRHCHEGEADLGMLGKFFTDHIRCGEPESEIVGALRPLPGERVLRKTTYDAFWETGLEEHLRGRGVAQVLVTGVLTQLCCETTARAAFVRGFEVYFAADATATSCEELHVSSLLGLASGVAVVMSAEEVLSLCSSGS